MCADFTTNSWLKMAVEFSPAVSYRKKNTERKKYRTSSEDTLRISPAVSYGRKKNHEVIEHILSVSVGKRGDLEITTKSYFTFFVRGENQKIIIFFEMANNSFYNST